MIRSFLRGLFTFYKMALSPFFGVSCRYAPTCSEYAQQALEHHGLVKGSWLATKRICRCHPWSEHGFDPVPGTFEAKQSPPESEKQEEQKNKTKD